MSLRIFYFILFFYFTNHIAYAGNVVSSQFYSKKGQLIVDSTFHISKQQLKKFTLIEKQLSEQLLSEIWYSYYLIHYEISFETIISFTVDENGYLSNLHLEKLKSPDRKFENKLSQEYYVDLNKIVKHFNDSIRKEIKAPKGKCQEYYLPFKFEATSNGYHRGIENGWILIQYPKMIPHLIERE